MIKYMKTLAVLTLIFGVIGGIVLGTMHQVLVAPEYSFQEATLGFGWETMISTWVYSLIGFGVLYSIGKILELLEKIAEPNVENAPSSELPPYATRIQPETNEAIPQTPRLGYTVCRKCGEENKPFELYCGKCGNKL